MNSRKISFALATIAALTSGIALPSQAAPSPTVGVTCTAGFTGEVVNRSFRCKKEVKVLIENICTNPQFPKLVLRAKAVPNPDKNNFNINGADICSKNSANLPSVGPLTGFNLGTDFVQSQPDPDAKRKAEAELEAGFVRGTLKLPSLAKKRQVEVLPKLAANQREAVFVSQKFLIDDDGDADDHTRVTFNVFVFPIQTP